MDKVITAKLVNFFFTLLVAVIATYLIRPNNEKGSF